MLADVVELHDIGVRQVRDGLGLDLKADLLLHAGVLAVQEHLEGDPTIRLHLPGSVDDAHAAATEHSLDLVAGDRRDRSRGHVRGFSLIGDGVLGNSPEVGGSLGIIGAGRRHQSSSDGNHRQIVDSGSAR